MRPLVKFTAGAHDEGRNRWRDVREDMTDLFVDNCALDVVESAGRRQPCPRGALLRAVHGQFHEG